MNIVALGTVACGISDKLKIYPQYKIYQINDEIQKKNRYFLKVPKYDSPQDYELKFPIKKIETFFKGFKGETIFITCGSESISLLSLVVLEQLSKTKRVSVLYVRPDLMFLNQNRREQEKLVLQQLQIYAIYDFLEQIYLIDNSMVEKVVSELDVTNYDNQINEVISWAIHSINYYEKQTSIANNFITKENYGIKTIGINKFMEDSEEKMLFSLDNVIEKRYYYIISKDTLKSDKTLLSKIRENIKEKVENEKCKIFYGMYSSDLKENMILSTSQTMTIQK